MNRFTLIGCVFLVTSSEIATASEPQPVRPNIVLILADDLGWSDLACYGSDLHETPHLDRLASESVHFTQAYAASPVCTPTRASILTGKYPARLHMTIWRESAAERGGHQLLEPIARGDLPQDEITLAELLHEAGYYTAHVGKWHLGSADNYPEVHGFDVNIGGTLWGAPQSFFYPYRGDQYFRDWRYVPDLEPGSEGDYLTDRLTDKALEIIDREAERPFFLNLWYHSVHTPIEGKPELVEKYRYRLREDGPRTHRNPDYAAMVESLDTNVGRVLAKLDEKGINERTIVVFLSDNGGFIGRCKLHPDLPVTDNAPLRSGKGSLYEGGTRVPLMIRWPSATVAGECDTPVFSCDLYPTLLNLAGIEPDAEHVPDGIDISPLLREPAEAIPERPLFFHYPHYYVTTTPVSAVRVGDWKLLHYYQDERVELYNLADDPSETNDLAPTMPAVAERLERQLRDWLNIVDAQLPEPNPK